MTANNLYYPLDRIPQFWDWLEQQFQKDLIKMPREIFDEIADGSDDLAAWVKSEKIKSSLLLQNEKADPSLVQKVLCDGYQSNDPKFSDSEIDKIGKDAFLIAYALAASGRVVVTKEVSKRKARLGNTKIPDACSDCGVACIDDFTLYRKLDLRLK